MFVGERRCSSRRVLRWLTLEVRYVSGPRRPPCNALVTKTTEGRSGTLRWCAGRTVCPLAEDHLPGSPSNRGLSKSLAHRYYPSNTRVRGRDVGMRPIFVLQPRLVVGARGV